MRKKISKYLERFLNVLQTITIIIFIASILLILWVIASYIFTLAMPADLFESIRQWNLNVGGRIPYP